MSVHSAKENFTKDPVRWFAWPILSGVLFVVVGLGALKFYEDGMRSRERGRLVSSIVDQQFRELSSARPANDASGNTFRLADDSADLRRWLVRESFKPDETPAEVASRLRAISRSHASAMSPVLRESVSRWISSLQGWNEEMNDRKPHPSLLEEARQHYFEAAGYQKIGRSYDATVLHLETISLLTRFIDRNPFSSRVPEALFMLGVAYLNLGHALPPQMRRDRILTLCGELYPDSLWASRSDTIWKEVFSDEI